jgi:hypothetical protein
MNSVISLKLRLSFLHILLIVSLLFFLLCLEKGTIVVALLKQKYFMKKMYVSFLMLFISVSGFSQFQFADTYQENFDAMGSSATANVPNNFKVSTNNNPRTVTSFASTNPTTQNAGNNLSSTAAPGIYNFGDAANATDRSLGALGGTAVQSANFYLYLKNGGATGISSFNISYDVEKYRNGMSATGAAIMLYYSLDGVNFTAAPASFTTTFTANSDNSGSGTAPMERRSITNQMLMVGVPAGQDLYLAWNYSAPSGSFTANDAIALGIDNITIKANFNPLPIGLANFKAAQRTNAIEVSWNALSESNMLLHEVQRSTNGSSFASIGTVNAQNSSVVYKYNFLDAAPLKGNNYYRLRSVSLSGEVSYSNILRLNMGAGKTDMTIISNPVRSGVVNLQLSNMTKGKYTLNVFNNVGQQLANKLLDLTDGSSTEHISLPSNAARGIYFVQLTNGSVRFTKQISVQ